MKHMVRRWRVTTVRQELRDPPRNPFLVHDIFALPALTRRRTYEFEAADENQCQQLFSAAQADGAEEVRGFSIESVEEISPNK